LNDDLIDWLRLVRTSGIGPITFRQLLQRFGSAGAALAALPDLARRGGGKTPRIATADDARREMALVEKLGARYLSVGQGLYPRLLAALEDASEPRETLYGPDKGAHQQFPLWSAARATMTVDQPDE